MLVLLKQFLPLQAYEMLEEWLPETIINSFDCARFSMGVAQIAFDPLVILPKINFTSESLEEKVDILEAHVRHLSDCIDNIIKVKYLSVWNLGGTSETLREVWEVAPPLRRKLCKLDQKFGAPDVLLYEFQMGANDKSRMVSTMIAYHYFDKRTLRIPPAVKNTMCPRKNISREEFITKCPVTAKKKLKSTAGKLTLITDLLFTSSHINLDIQSFLAIVTDTYKANKLHTSACLEWWASMFSIDMSWVPKDCLDDAADAFMQFQGALRKGLF